MRYKIGVWATLLVLALAGPIGGQESVGRAVQPLWAFDFPHYELTAGDSVTVAFSSQAERITFTCELGGSLWVWNGDTYHPAPTQYWRFKAGEEVTFAIPGMDSVRVLTMGTGSSKLTRFILEKR